MTSADLCHEMRDYRGAVQYLEHSLRQLLAVNHADCTKEIES